MRKIFTYVAAAMLVGSVAVSVANAEEGSEVNLMEGAIPADQCNQTPSAPWVAYNTATNETGAGNGWQFRNSEGAMNGAGDAALLFFRWNDKDSKWVYGYKIDNFVQGHIYKFTAKITTNDNKYNALIVGLSQTLEGFAEPQSTFSTELYQDVNNWESMTAASVKTAEGTMLATFDGEGYVTFQGKEIANGNMIIRAWDFQLYDMGEDTAGAALAEAKANAQTLLDQNARLKDDSKYKAVEDAIANEDITLEEFQAVVKAFSDLIPTLYLNAAVDAENDNAEPFTEVIVNPNPVADNDLSGWTVTGNSNMRTMSNEGPETYMVLPRYFDTNAWQKDWNFTVGQEVKLPAGVYRLAVMSRAATDRLTKYELYANVKVNEAATEGGESTMKKIETGVNVSGSCDMIPYLTGNANNTFGRGWGIYWCDFTVAQQDSAMVEIGVAGTGYMWASFGGFMLTKIDDVTAPDPASKYNEVKAAALAAYENEENANALNGEEAAALKALLDQENVTDYDAAAEELSVALAKFLASVPAYNKYAAERNVADGIFAIVNNEAAEAYVKPISMYIGDNWPGTAEAATVWADSLVMAYPVALADAAVGGAYTDAENMTSVIVNPEGTTMDGWTAETMRINHGEGPTNTFTMDNYFDSNGWAENAWTMSQEQVVTIPAGVYRLSVLSRASADVEDYILAGIVTEETEETTAARAIAELDSIADANGQVELYTLGNQGNFYGNGWGISWCDFSVANDNTPVTIKVSAHSSVIHNWLSFGNFQLIKLKAKKQSVGINAIEAANADVKFYNLHGVEVKNPANGVFIKVQNGKATKVVK